MKQKHTKKLYKKILLIAFGLFIVLIIVSSIPTYKKYNLESEKVKIFFRAKELTIHNQDEIAKITNLINNGKDGTELILKEYNRGLNKISLKKTGESACILDLKIIFNNVEIEVCSNDGHGYIYEKDSRTGITISKETIKYIAEKF